MRHLVYITRIPMDTLIYVRIYAADSNASRSFMELKKISAFMDACIAPYLTTL